MLWYFVYFINLILFFEIPINFVLNIFYLEMHTKISRNCCKEASSWDIAKNEKKIVLSTKQALGTWSHYGQSKKHVKAVFKTIALK